MFKSFRSKSRKHSTQKGPSNDPQSSSRNANVSLGREDVPYIEPPNPTSTSGQVHHVGIFSNAQNFFIEGGTFISRPSMANVYGGKSGLDILRERSAPGAFHNSVDRFDPPKCHPETRKAVIEEIMGWIKDDDEASPRVLCMTGAAGAGKTALEQTVAEMCEAEGLLAASFFFSAVSPQRNNTKCLIPSLAYQIAVSIPDARVYIAQAVDKDPWIFEQRLEAQIKHLLVEPLGQAGWSPGSPPRLWPHAILIDGLDECTGEEHQTQVLRAIRTAVVDEKLPFRFFIASRPEVAIRTALSDYLNGIVRHLVLDAQYDPDTDIKLFLLSKFAGIRRKDPGLRALAWPDDRIMDTLVSNASGQFIYLSTVTKFVDEHHKDPANQLQLILKWSTPGNKGRNPFASLDALYSMILESAQKALFDEVDFREFSRGDLPIIRLLRYIMALSDDSAGNTNANPRALDEFFFSWAGTTERLLSDLHSLVQMPVLPTHQISFYHKSFEDFLNDPTRSGKFYIPTPRIWGDIACRCLQIVSTVSNDDLSSFWGISPSSKIPFSSQMWALACSRSILQDDTVDVLDALRNFLAHIKRDQWSASDPPRPSLIYIRIMKGTQNPLSLFKLTPDSPNITSLLRELQVVVDSCRNMLLDSFWEDDKLVVQTKTGIADEVWRQK